MFHSPIVPSCGCNYSPPDAACKEINYYGSKAMFEIMAERIIAAARIGERDPIRLQAAALAGIPRER
jgi:hypothetical protein